MAVVGSHRPGQLAIHLLVTDVEAAARFYIEVFGAGEICRHHALSPLDPPQREAVGVELSLAGVHLVVGRENPRWREAPRPDWPRAPSTVGAASSILSFYVDSVDAVLARALAAGATTRRQDETPEDAFFGDRVIVLHDPFGHVWCLKQRREDVASEELGSRLQALVESRRAARAAG